MSKLPSVVYRTGYDNRVFALVTEDGKAVSLGDVVMSFRGEEYVLTGGDAPHKPSSSGKVYVKPVNSEHSTQFFPSVFDLKFKEVTPEYTFAN